MIMALLTGSVASPRGLAEKMGASVRHVAYHVKVLRDLECVTLVKVEAARGGRVAESFYRAAHRPYVDDEAWEMMDEREKNAVSMSIMRLVNEDVNASLAAGTFLDPDDSHISRTPMDLDMQGWHDTNTILTSAVDAVIKVQEECAERIRAGSEPALSTKVVVLHFRSPSEDP